MIIGKKKCLNHHGRPIWSKGLCRECFLRENPPKPLKKTVLKPISQKHKKLLGLYKVVRAEYLKQHPICELNVEGCTKIATEIHHTAKKQTQSDWVDIKYFKATCRNCHHKVEMSPALAKELGIYNYTL